MEKGQKDHITTHMNLLMENTICSDYLLASLASKKLLIKMEQEDINSFGPNMSKVKRMFEILQTKKDSYALLIESLTECLQTGSADILKKYTGFIPSKPNITTTSNIMIPRGSLHKAVRQGNIEDLKHFISFGANVNETNAKWETALHELKNTRKNWVPLTKILMDSGITFDAPNSDNDNVAHCISVNEYISKKDYHDWVTLVLEKGYGDLWYQKGWRGRTPLHSAMATMDINKETINMILEKTEMNIDERNEYMNTPLHLAIMFGRKLETLKNLVELGANVNLTDKHGNGVLHKAICEGDLDAVKYFVDCGANVNLRNNKKNTPLHNVAWAKCDHVELTRILLNAGADLNAKDRNGRNVSQLLKLELGEDEYINWVEFVRENVVAEEKQDG